MSGKFIKTISDLPSCCTNPKEDQTEVQEFYRGVNVFITGELNNPPFLISAEFISHFVPL